MNAIFTRTSVRSYEERLVETEKHTKSCYGCAICYEKSFCIHHYSFWLSNTEKSTTKSL